MSMVIFNILLPGLAAAIVLLSATGIGMYLLKLSKLENTEMDVVELPIGMALGLCVSGYVSDLIYMSQIIDMRLYFVLIICFGLVSLKLSWLYIMRLLFMVKSLACVAIPKYSYTYRIVGWAIIFLFFAGLYMHNVVPVNDNDSLIHYAFLSKIVAAGIPFDEMLLIRNMPITDLNRLIPMIYAQGYLLFGTSSSHLMNFVFICVIILMVQLACVSYTKEIDLWNPLPILLILTVHEIIFTGVMAKVDYGVAMVIVAAVLATISYKRRSAWILSLLFGMIICARTSAIYMALAIIIVFFGIAFYDYVIVEKRNSMNEILKYMKFTVLVGLGALLISSPPLILNYLIYGNPLFPFYNGILGNYKHFYDYMVFNSLRYNASGLFAPALIYAQLSTHGFMRYFFGYYAILPGYNHFGLGIGPFFLFAPFALIKKREYIIILAFFIISFLFWSIYSSHTHRSFLGVAFAGVFLIVGVICKLRSVKAVYYSVIAILLLLASTTVKHMSYRHFTNPTIINRYCTGKIGNDAFYQNFIKPHNYLYYSPNIDELKAIKNITEGNLVTCVNTYIQIHPEIVKVYRFDLPSANMHACLERSDLDEEDRYTIKNILQNEYLIRRFEEISEIYWPDSGILQKPVSRRQIWEIASKHYDADYFVMDAVLEKPEKIINIMKFRKSYYLLARKHGSHTDFNVSGLNLVWHSDEVNLFKIADDKMM